jgi:hypothetical protein
MTDALAEVPLAQLDDVDAIALHGALNTCAAQIQSGNLYPFPNPMGLPRL